MCDCVCKLAGKGTNLNALFIAAPAEHSQRAVQDSKAAQTLLIDTSHYHTALYCCKDIPCAGLTPNPNPNPLKNRSPEP